MIPTREVYWNVRHIRLMYALLIPTLLLFSDGIYRRKNVGTVQPVRTLEIAELLDLANEI